MASYTPVLTKDSISKAVLEAKYAVRGPVPERAGQIEREMEEGKQYPYKNIIYCNIGNPQLLGQRPLTYFRQICSLVVFPDLLDNPKAKEIYPADVLARAKFIHSHTPGGVGSYSHSQGLAFVRKDVADFISKRDGYTCDPRTVFMSQGASPGIQSILQIMIRGPTDGCLIPIPQYPLYTGTLALFQGRAVPYQLDESTGWSLSVADMTRAVEEAKKLGITVRGVVIINPGNPTGACLPEANILDILRYAHKERLVVLADEVYQTNIYRGETKPFVPFRRILKANEKELEGLELVTFNSISKGFLGECGMRGGYYQMENIDPVVHSELLKLASLSLCPNSLGQIVVDLMVKPPQPGDESFELYEKEKTEILESLKRRARRLTESFNSLECCSCEPVESAMYAFPNISIPPRAVEAAKEKGQQPDEFYSFSLLESQGLCVVPGSGFGQEKGTHHIRTTILPAEKDFDDVVNRFATHHKEFIAKYADKEWLEEEAKKKKKSQ